MGLSCYSRLAGTLCDCVSNKKELFEVGAGVKNGWSGGAYHPHFSSHGFVERLRSFCFIDFGAVRDIGRSRMKTTPDLFQSGLILFFVPSRVLVESKPILNICKCRQCRAVFSS